MDLHLEKMTRKDILIIKIKGAITIYSLSQFEDYVFGNIDDLKNIGLDFDKVNFVDSAGIGSIVRLHQFLNKNNGSVYMFNLNKRMKEIISTVNLDEVLNVMNYNEFCNIFPG